MRVSYRPFLLFGLLLLTAALAGPVTAQDAPVGQIITVQEGENLLDVAVRTDTSVLCIRLANDLPPLPGLTGISQLFIPADCASYLKAGAATGAATAQTVVDESYTVQKGDRLAKIAEQFGVTVSCLAQANRIANPDLIYVGQVLVIPVSCQGGGGAGSTAGGADAVCRFDRNAGRVATNGLYTVRAGDMLDFIACDFGIALECLLTSNPQISNRGRIAIGDQLTISLACPSWRDSTLPPISDASG